MEKAARRIGMFTSGGDAPSMNTATRAAVCTSLYMGIERVGIHRGYHGLVNGDLTKLAFENVSGLSCRSGTMLYSIRNKELKTPAGQERAVATCKMLGLDALVGTSGDGTFSDLLCLVKRGLPVVDAPGTIDSDIACSSYTVGYGTACNTALESIDKLQDTMQSHERCPVVGVMSHRAGHLALTVGVAYGATAMIILEHPVDHEADLLEPVRRARLVGRAHFMITVTGGVEGGAYSTGKIIEEATTLDTRVIALGHIQWGGSSSFRGRITATYMGYEAVRLLAEGKTCWVAVLRGENYVDYDTTEALRMTKSLGQYIYEVMRALIDAY